MLTDVSKNGGKVKIDLGVLNDDPSAAEAAREFAEKICEGINGALGRRQLHFVLFLEPADNPVKDERAGRNIGFDESDQIQKTKYKPERSKWE